MVTFTRICSSTIRIIDRIGRIEFNGIRILLDGLVVLFARHERVSSLLVFIGLGLVICRRCFRLGGRSAAGACPKLVLSLQIDIEDALEGGRLDGKSLDLGLIGRIDAKGFTNALN